jgi:hypothetical protein
MAAHVDATELEIGAALFVVTLAGSAIATALVLRGLPADYLRRESVPDDRPRSIRLLRSIGKNVLGVLLIALGAVMSLPGVPGQGVLTMVIGLMLLDFPGKRAMERRLMGRPSVLAAINRVRLRFGRDPLLPPEEAAPPAPPSQPSPRSPPAG